jgi:hypothetical protein
MRCGILLRRPYRCSGESGPEVRERRCAGGSVSLRQRRRCDACRLDSAGRVPTESALRRLRAFGRKWIPQPAIAEPSQGSIGPTSDPELAESPSAPSAGFCVSILVACAKSPRIVPDTFQTRFQHRHRPNIVPIPIPWYRALAQSCLRAASSSQEDPAAPPSLPSDIHSSLPSDILPTNLDTATYTTYTPHDPPPNPPHPTPRAMSQFHHLVKTQPAQVTALNLPPNTSCVLLKKRTISVEATPLPILQPDGVLVKVISTG